MEKLICVGVDIFVFTDQPQKLPEVPQNSSGLKLNMISQRGLKVWPGPMPSDLLVPWFRCRYLNEASSELSDEQITQLLKQFEAKKVTWEKVQKLFRGEDGKDRFLGDYES